MILVDPRTGSADLRPLILAIGIPCELEHLDYADAAFEGFGPNGRIMIGVERKKIDDMLQCIQDGRFSGHQRIGLMQQYKARFLMVEGFFSPSRQGVLQVSIDGSWFFNKKQGKTLVMYQRLYRYLLSVGFSGVTVTHSRDAFHTAFNICEIYHWFQKKWDAHQSMMKAQDIAVPSMHVQSRNQKPPLAVSWAAALTDVGPKLSARAAQHFKTGVELANADVEDWLCVPGIGQVSAEKIVNEICGVK